MYRIFLSVLITACLLTFDVLSQQADAFNEDKENLLNGSITGVDPGSATIPQSLTVEISGSATHFAMGTGTSVWFSQGSSTIYSYNPVAVNNLLVQAAMTFTNNHDPGYYNVNTYNEYDGQLTLYSGFYLNANPNPPMLVDVEPSSGQAGEMVYLVITGQYTNFTQASNYVTLAKPGGGGTTAISVAALDDETLEAHIPLPTGSTPGLYNLFVYNYWDGNLGLINAFEIMADPDPPYLIGIDPDEGTIPETLMVTISGTNTHFDQGTGTSVTLKQSGFPAIYASSVNPLSNAELNATFVFDNLDAPGYYDVRTISELDGFLELEDAFLLNPNPFPPALSSIDPSQAEPGDMLDVEITGLNTSFTQGTGTSVWLHKGNLNIYPNSVNMVNDELLDVNFDLLSNTPVGYYDVNTHNYVDGLLTLAEAFLIDYFYPGIVQVAPGSGYLNDTVTLQVTGENTHFMEAASSMSGWLRRNNMQIFPLSVSPVSNTLVEMEFPLSGSPEAGFWDVCLQNEMDDSICLQNGFEILDTISGYTRYREAVNFHISPNPGHGIFNLSFSSPVKGGIRLSVYNSQGGKVKDYLFTATPIKNKPIDLSACPEGAYIMHISFQGHSFTEKIIISR